MNRAFSAGDVGESNPGALPQASMRPRRWRSDFAGFNLGDRLARNRENPQSTTLLPPWEAPTAPFHPLTLARNHDDNAIIRARVWVEANGTDNVHAVGKQAPTALFRLQPGASPQEKGSPSDPSIAESAIQRRTVDESTSVTPHQNLKSAIQFASRAYKLFRAQPPTRSSAFSMFAIELATLKRR